MNSQNAINSLDINRKDMVLIIGDSIGDNIESSLRLATRLQQEAKNGHRVLYINTVQSRQAFGQKAREVLGPEFREYDPDGLECRTLVRGSLASASDEAEGMFRGKRAIRTVVINSWEFASEDYRMRERAVFMLRRWIGEDNVQVIVFAQFKGSMPSEMKVQAGGLGKLAGLASAVCDLREQTISKNVEEPEEEQPGITQPAVRPTREKPVYDMGLNEYIASIKKPVDVLSDVGELQGFKEGVSLAEAA